MKDWMQLLRAVRDANGKVIDHDDGVSGGAFQIHGLRVIASWGEGWDHVSVSLPNRTPLYEEMEFVRSIFFLDNETAMQLSVPRTDHINNHSHCLHLWRPHHVDIPRPPSWMVGIPGLKVLA